METEERTPSYGHSLIIAKKTIMIEGKEVEVRLVKTNSGTLLPRAKFVIGSLKIQEAYEKGFQDGLNSINNKEE